VLKESFEANRVFFSIYPLGTKASGRLWFGVRAKVILFAVANLWLCGRSVTIAPSSERSVRGQQSEDVTNENHEFSSSLEVHRNRVMVERRPQ
jgi:hypothetical protein